jgi:acyl-[acyl-carrier-protein]-phospholipid O-acyltransferase / long-chain-fatty-acid--[acyl-carrier-protein] ligase
MDASPVNKPDSSSPNGSHRGFWSLIITQFQGAFSDNALKQITIFLGVSIGMSQVQRDQLVSLATALLTLPFILFSMAGGHLANRWSKRTVTIGIKIFEIFVMGLAMVGLVLRSVPAMLACVFLMGVHSAIFGPSKYGSLPELLPERQLSWGNGILELGTFLAIILGTVAGGVLSQVFGPQPVWAGVTLVALAFFGLISSVFITRTPAADPAHRFRLNFPSEVWSQIRIMRRDRVLWLALLGNTYFWFLAALLQQNIIIYGLDVLKTDQSHNSYLQAAVGIGIGLGSFAAGYLSGGKIEYGLIPLGAIGMTVMALVLSMPGLSFLALIIALALLGFFGGFYAVPINALLQHRPARADKAGVLAAQNLISSAGVFVAAGVYYLMQRVWPRNPSSIFLVSGIATLAATGYMIWLLPDALLRFVLWFLTRTVYRIRVIGRENIPAKGGALFVCNHLSLADAMLLLASTDRHVRFMMYKAHYELPWIKPFARILGVIPISSEQRPREMLNSLQTASDAIKNGEVVCIFAEGQITRIGQMMPFRRGFERIMKDVEAPIIPIALDGVWGSIFSFDRGRFIWKWPRRFPHPITVNYGKPMPHTATPFEVRQVVQELQAEAWAHRKTHMKTLHRAFVRTARKHPFRFAMADAQNKKVRFGSALARTIFLARRLKKIRWGETPDEARSTAGRVSSQTVPGVNQKMIGVFLPPSVPGALVNFAVLLAGKVPVNLNYTVSEETLASCIRQCDIKSVITSNAFLEKVKLKVPCHTVFLEELVARPGLTEKIAAFFMTFFFPTGLLERALGREKKVTLDDLATVIFSSGSTGEPKGVMLSHYNIAANIEQLEQVFGLGRTDCVIGVLPFFHSFGFTGTLFLPAVVGVGAIYHPNPLDAKTIGPLVSDYSATFLLATPTFLQLYMRGCAAQDFGSLRVVMTGAEKLPDRLAAAFEEHFGIRPLEGYGCTECSPAVAVNTHDFRSAGFRQVGAKRGKIGHPLSGISVRIVDPDTRAPLPMGQSGLMLVRGPNVMLGYLGKPEKTAEVLIPDEALNRSFSLPTNAMTGIESNLIQSPGTVTKLPPLPGGEGRGEGERKTNFNQGGCVDTGSHLSPPAHWYVTGDIAAIDEDGFLQITDRLSRFSKIGGEMVPHIKVEDRLHELAGSTAQTFVVAGVPDEKKGERLVVLHKLKDDQLQSILEKLSQTDLPNLWKPRADQFFQVENFPMLGTGKLDLRKVKETAAVLAQRELVIQ